MRLAQLHEHALRTGASVKIEGQHFNSSGVKAPPMLRKAAPAPVSHANITPEHLRPTIAEHVAHAVQEHMAKMPAAPAAPAIRDPAPPRPWSFRFERHANGTINRVVADNGSRTVGWTAQRDEAGRLVNVQAESTDGTSGNDAGPAANGQP
jgi:hypothetical protein